jgi:hypothetical protein
MVEFRATVERIKLGNKAVKTGEIKRLLTMDGLLNHHTDKSKKRVVMAICEEFEYAHEHHTAKKLTAANYDVILLPHGLEQQRWNGNVECPFCSATKVYRTNRVSNVLTGFVLRSSVLRLVLSTRIAK